MKITLTPSKKTNVMLSVLSILAGLALTFIERSWIPLIFISFLSIVPSIVFISALSAAKVIIGGHPWDIYSSIHTSIALSGVAVILVGALSIVERLVWFNANIPPSIIIAKTYGDRYTANKHRMFRFKCESRGGGQFSLREIDGQVYVRCGEWYPEVYTVSASQKAYAQAEVETRNDPPNMGYILEND